MKTQQPPVSPECFHEPWVTESVKWLDREMDTAIKKIVLEGAELTQAAQMAIQTALVGVPDLWRERFSQHIHSAAEVEVTGERILVEACTKAVREAIGPPTLAVCRLLVEKPYMPLMVYWTNGDRLYFDGTDLRWIRRTYEEMASIILAIFPPAKGGPVSLHGQLTAWICEQPEQWSITADQLLVLITPEK